MTIYDVPNIEHCYVRPLGDPVIGYRIEAHEGWYIHINNGIEETKNWWKTVIGVRTDFDFSLIDIRAEADLPPDAEKHNVNKPNSEVM